MKQNFINKNKIIIYKKFQKYFIALNKNKLYYLKKKVNKILQALKKYHFYMDDGRNLQKNFSVNKQHKIFF